MLLIKTRTNISPTAADGSASAGPAFFCLQTNGSWRCGQPPPILLNTISVCFLHSSQWEKLSADPGIS